MNVSICIKILFSIYRYTIRHIPAITHWPTLYTSGPSLSSLSHETCKDNQRFFKQIVEVIAWKIFQYTRDRTMVIRRAKYERICPIEQMYYFCILSWPSSDSVDSGLYIGNILLCKLSTVFVYYIFWLHLIQLSTLEYCKIFLAYCCQLLESLFYLDRLI